MIDKTLKILLLEDLKADQELIKRAVSKVAPKAVFVVAQDKQEFEDKISWVEPDLILSDYNLPDYNGLEALLLVRSKMPHVPFIFITGMLNDEEKAAEAILKGGSGYILKNDLASLPHKLDKILRKEEDLHASRAAAEQRKRRRKLLLQKLQAILQQAAPFPEKEQLEEVLNEIMDTSNK